MHKMEWLKNTVQHRYLGPVPYGMFTFTICCIFLINQLR